MTRKLIIGLILIGVTGIVVVSYFGFSHITKVDETKTTSPEEVKVITDEPNEEVKVEEVENTETTEDDQASQSANSDLDKNGDPREKSKYLDSDGDTIANYYDICPNIDDNSEECQPTQTSSNDSDSSERSTSKRLDDDGDTVANYYDVCPGKDDFGSECDTSKFN